MAADSTSKATPGSPFRPPPANLWNSMIDAGQAFANGQFSSGPTRPTRPRETDLIKLKNSSGGNRRKGEILKFGTKVIEAIADEHIWLDGVAPTGGCRFGILKDPVLDEEVVTAQVTGVCLALVNVIEETHTFADAASGEYVLQSSEAGPLEILYVSSGTGEKECVIRFAGGATDDTPRRIECEIIEWNSSALHGPGATCRVITKNNLGTIFNSIVSEGDIIVTVYDNTSGSSIFGDGASIAGKTVWADLMMPADQAIPCPPETGVAGETPPTSACRWIASERTC